MQPQTKLRLYGDRTGQPMRAVLTLLAIGRIDFEFITVDLHTLQTRSKQFLELNPFGRSPFLVDGELKLAESNAILLYICQKYPHLPKSLSGKTIQEKAVINQYLSWYQNEFRPIFAEPIAVRIRYLLTKKDGMLCATSDEYAQKRILETAKLLDKLLRQGGKQFLCGDELSVADLLIYHEYNDLLVYEMSFPDLVSLKSWQNRMEGIPEVAKIAQEALELIPSKIKFFNSVRPLQPRL